MFSAALLPRSIDHAPSSQTAFRSHAQHFPCTQNARHSRLSKFFRMNTCKSVSKQGTLTAFRMNTYEKTGGRGVHKTPLFMHLALSHQSQVTIHQPPPHAGCPGLRPFATVHVHPRFHPPEAGIHGDTVSIPQELLDILVCPVCKTPVKLAPDNSSLKCQSPACRRVYPVRDDIPVMLPEEATIAPE